MEKLQSRHPERYRAQVMKAFPTPQDLEKDVYRDNLITEYHLDRQKIKTDEQISDLQRKLKGEVDNGDTN